MAARADELRQAVDEAMQRLRQLQADPTDSADQPEVRGEGTALDGQVRVVAGADGRLEEVTIDRRATQLDPRVLGEEVKAAVNAAVDDLRENYARAAQESAADQQELLGRLQEVQHTSVARLETFLRELTDSHLRIAGQQQQRG